VHLDLSGRVLASRRLELEGESNNGLEGICLDGEGLLYTLNEKKPGLFIELDADLSIQRRERLRFAGDYSGLDWDSTRNAFWIASDEDRALYLWNREEGVIGRYGLPFPGAEGVAVNETSGRIYVVSDPEAMLYVFAFD
jgi:uncharacterized protein YjiK